MWNRHEVNERSQRIANFVAGARQGVVNLTSMDCNKAKEDVQRVIDSSTGQFHDDFQARAKISRPSSSNPKWLPKEP